MQVELDDKVAEILKPLLTSSHQRSEQQSKENR
jgi:hypothetical protein